MRARSRGWSWLVSFFLAASLLGGVSQASAQVSDTVPPQQPDTAQVDTAVVAIPPEEVGGDTIPEEIQQQAEAETPVALMPVFPEAEPPGWDVARWSWNREELALLPGLTLLEFIERLPGMVAIRAGGFGRPVGLTTAGLGGASVRVRVDGYTLDPHDAFSYPLESISLVDLSRVTVERSLGEILVDVESYRLDQNEPYSVIQLGTGVFQTRLLRALFSRGFGSRSVGTGAFDMVRTGGIGIGEVYRHSSTNFRWSFVPTAGAGLEIDWRRTALDRGGTVFPLQTTRSDLVLRGRANLGQRGALEAYVGRSNADEDPPEGEEVELLGSLQAGARAAFATERLGAEGGVVFRSDRGGPPLATPGLEAEAAAVLRPFGALRIQGDARHQSGAGLSASAFRVVGTLSPPSGVSLFASLEGGSRLQPIRVTVPGEGEQPPTTEFGLASSDVAETRLGAGLSTRLGSLDFAVVEVGSTPISPFGLPFDVSASPQTVGGSRGMEGYLNVPLVTGETSFRVEGWYTRWFEDVTRIYTPADIGRGWLTYHGVYIGGQFEPLARLELIHQGPLLAPIGTVDQPLAIMPSYNTLNFELRIRIIDVQAFLLWDNLLTASTGLPVESLPVPQPRIIYGASWRFRN